jgi:ORF6N domain
MAMARTDLTSAGGKVERSIVYLRGQGVILDNDLARLYQVPTKALVQAVHRNRSRFPTDFMFQLSIAEFELLRSQFVTSNVGLGRGGRRYRPYAFTEQGVAMLSSVLRSRRAVSANIEIMRAFVRLRRLAMAQTDLVRKLKALEQKYDARFKVVFDVIRRLMAPPAGASKPIGFRPRGSVSVQ